VYALATPHEARSMRSAGIAPIERIIPKLQAAFAFTAPLGLGNPMTRTHVRLLGPCFKTGRRRRRPTRNRDASRAREDTRCTSPLNYPPAPKPGTRGLAETSKPNFTHALGPVPAVRCVNRAGEMLPPDRRQPRQASLRITNARPTPKA
jgi:hypothetical protein